MQEIDQTEELKDAGTELQRLYKAGELFEDPPITRESREVKESLERLSAALGSELWKIGRERHPALAEAGEHTLPRSAVLFNGMVLIESDLGGGWCAFGGYDYATGDCEYFGTGRCIGARP